MTSKPATHRMLAFLAATLLLVAAAFVLPSSGSYPPLHGQAVRAKVGSGRDRELRAARDFIAGYLRWLAGSTQIPPGISHRLAAGLRAHSRRLAPAERERQQRLVGLAIVAGPRPRVRVLISDSEGVSYPLQLSLTQVHGRLIVTHLGTAER